jgi:hypothetical protein
MQMQPGMGWMGGHGSEGGQFQYMDGSGGMWEGGGMGGDEGMIVDGVANMGMGNMGMGNMGMGGMGMGGMGMGQQGAMGQGGTGQWNGFEGF